MKYLYKCKCGIVFEREYSVAEYIQRNKIGVRCPKCGVSKTSRTYTDTVVIYKDNGFTKHVESDE